MQTLKANPLWKTPAPWKKRPTSTNSSLRSQIPFPPPDTARPFTNVGPQFTTVGCLFSIHGCTRRFCAQCCQCGCRNTVEPQGLQIDPVPRTRSPQSSGISLKCCFIRKRSKDSVVKSCFSTLKAVSSHCSTSPTLISFHFNFIAFCLLPALRPFHTTQPRLFVLFVVSSSWRSMLTRGESL